MDLLTEANSFDWPGPDLRPTDSNAEPTDIAYGLLPQNLFEKIRDKFLAHPGTETPKLVKRA